MRRSDFVEEIREYVDDTVLDYADALYAAMQQVDEVKPGVFFGQIGDATFYMGQRPGSVHWFPDSMPSEVRHLLKDCSCSS